MGNKSIFIKKKEKYRPLYVEVVGMLFGIKVKIYH